MTATSKSILRNSINVFLASTNKEKEVLVQKVQNNLEIHYNALNSIGMGCVEDQVKAGEIFLRIFSGKNK
jgi:hypothetical protein